MAYRTVYTRGLHPLTLFSGFAELKRMKLLEARGDLQLPRNDGRLSELRGALYNTPRPDDEKYAINETKSEGISLTREIPDTRPPECKNKVYNISRLPTVRYEWKNEYLYLFVAPDPRLILMYEWAFIIIKNGTNLNHQERWYILSRSYITPWFYTWF